MCRHAGFWLWGSWAAGRSRGSGGESGSVRSAVCVFSLSVLLLLLLPLFAVLLNCLYPDPPVSACFFPFSSTPRRGEGRPRGAFVAGGSRNENSDRSCLTSK